MIRPIAISLSPNTQSDDVMLALKNLITPWNWYGNLNINSLENKFASYLGLRYSLSFNSGRSALYLGLEALGIKKGDEVIVQSFTCVAVVNAVHWLNAKPVFVDIDNSYNIDYEDLKSKITDDTKAIVIQHTFGIPANLDRILSLARSKKISVVEDCAHSLGASYAGQKLGTYGDLSIFSFGRDKVISSVFGGMIATDDKALYERLQKKYSQLGFNSYGFIVQQLLHPIIFNLIILPFYQFGIKNITLGKVILFILQKLRVLSKPVFKSELITNKPKTFPKKLDNALASLATHQLNKLDGFNYHRIQIAKYYYDNLETSKINLPKWNNNAIWLRFPIQLEESNELFNYSKARGILLGKWYSNVVDPECDLEKIGYLKGTNRNSERLSARILNLPTYPSLSLPDVKHVVETINQWQSTR